MSLELVRSQHNIWANLTEEDIASLQKVSRLVIAMTDVLEVVLFAEDVTLLDLVDVLYSVNEPDHASWVSELYDAVVEFRLEGEYDD